MKRGDPEILFYAHIPIRMSLSQCTTYILMKEQKKRKIKNAMRHKIIHFVLSKTLQKIIFLLNNFFLSSRFFSSFFSLNNPFGKTRLKFFSFALWSSFQRFFVLCDKLVFISTLNITTIRAFCAYWSQPVTALLRHLSNKTIKWWPSFYQTRPANRLFWIRFLYWSPIKTAPQL